MKIKMKNDSKMKKLKKFTRECLENIGESVLLGNWYL